ncbi:DUF5916 domain-containing protein [candidate division KSB1 bacterium]|nr:DUF5916 domain-containing protein [candidate division KSB1 bacterium]
MRPFLLSISFLLILFQFATSARAIEPLKPLRAETPPVIDGVLDDLIWQQAPFETGFMTYYPDYGSPMSESTRVWYAYDRENLYFAFKCYDHEPQQIKTSVTARDKIRPDDWICINLDSFNDQQTLYAFYTNPAGIQMDSRATLNSEDESIDLVWYSEAQVDDQGYNVELKIPFKSIRYSSREPVQMGIIFERYISRKSEAGTYPPLDPKWGQNFITQTRPLIYENIKHYRLVEILPAATFARNSVLEQERLTPQGDVHELGLTAKYGLTSHLVLDGALNPDFSQVEADAGQVDFNLRYALFYPEKRPFFLEGKENFVFGGSTEGDPLGAVVHTRTIVDPQAGLKLNGKIGEKNTLAVIYARDELSDPAPAEDYAHVGILRYKRALSQDNFLGGFFTNRTLNDHTNSVAGADGQIRINQSSFIGFHGFLSKTTDQNVSDAPMAPAVGVNYYYKNRDWFINLRIHDLAGDFNTETGYVTRAGVTRLRLGMIRMLYPKSQFFKRLDPLLNNQFILDKASGKWEHNNAAYLTLLMPRSSNLRLGYAYATEIFAGQEFKTSGFSLIAVSQLTRQFYFELVCSRGQKIRYQTNPYQGYGASLISGINYQPSEQFQASLDLTYSDLYRSDNHEKVFDYTILRNKLSYQWNRYLFFRVILEYAPFQNYELPEKSHALITDFLISFTYIPGTVMHLGYGSLYDKIKWQNDQYLNSDRFLETKRGFFCKLSYLWRM